MAKMSLSYAVSKIISELSSILLHLNYKSINADVPVKGFPCSNTTKENYLNVTESQFCNGVSDCADGFDEPSSCFSGNWSGVSKL